MNKTVSIFKEQTVSWERWSSKETNTRQCDKWLKVAQYKRLEYHKAWSSQLFSGLGDNEKSFYGAHIWVDLGGVSKACEERQGLQVEKQCGQIYGVLQKHHPFREGQAV